MINNTITAAKGFWAAGVNCGIKKSGKPDLAILVCPAGAKAAAMFTTNKIPAAPVIISKEHMKGRTINAIVVNSGNANACTGKKGVENAQIMCERAAEKLSVSPENILVASTGIIGKQLPMKNIYNGISKAAAGLSASAKAGRDFASAIMTTDTRIKQAVRKIKISGRIVTLAGTAKGAGMIAPNMATTLSFFATDIVVSKPLLKKAFKAAIGKSLNKLTVDGHQSTNDTAIILASGLTDNRLIAKVCGGYEKFEKALIELCCDLARQMAFDAEGATRIFKVVITGAATKADAAKAARAIAGYPLVKCAVAGDDPNWGRIICAVGSAGVKIKPDKIGCKIGAVTVFKNGMPVKFNVKEAVRTVRQFEHTITVNLGVGRYTDFCYGCDLTEEYVKINADYHT